MNINLAKAPAKKKMGVAALGFNARGATTAFGSDDSSSSEGEPVTGRTAVNRAITKEQAALRVRAAAAVASSSVNADIYDYDGAYDSFHSKSKDSEKEDSKESRYIGDLLKAAEQRKWERDLAHERKVARDQAAEEEAEPEFRGKEKFVTAAYKRKLEERKVWQANDEKQRLIEEGHDVTKQTDGVGIANFYGNLTKNVAMGGGTNGSKAPTGDNDDKTRPPRAGKIAGLDSWTGDGGDDELESADAVNGIGATSSDPNGEVQKDEIETAEDPTIRRKRMRLLREKKVEEARARYFQRLGLTAGKEDN